MVFDLGRVLIASGDRAAGAARYEELLTRGSLAEDMRFAVLGQLARARLFAGRIADAEAALQEALRLAGPGRPDLAAGIMVDYASQIMLTYGYKRAAPLTARARELAADASIPVRAAADAVGR